jgi:hypothetical protein
MNRKPSPSTTNDIVGAERQLARYAAMLRIRNVELEIAAQGGQYASLPCALSRKRRAARADARRNLRQSDGMLRRSRWIDASLR